VIDGSEHIRRSSAGRDSHQRIHLHEARSGKIASTFFARIFRVFAGKPQRSVAAGDESLHQVCADGKCRRALAGIEYAESSAGSRTDVEQPAAACEALCDGVDGSGYLRQLCADSARNLCVFVVHHGEHFERWKLIEVFGGRITSFGEELREGGLVGCFHAKSMIPSSVTARSKGQSRVNETVKA